MQKQKKEAVALCASTPQILVPLRTIEAKGEHAATGITTRDNLLIKGDNLAVLRALHATHTKKVKLIYIDPPYNTGAGDFHYPDNLERSVWLDFMRQRLEACVPLLAENGAIIVQCDDNEQAYLKVLMDTIFPNGFLNCIAVKMSEATGVKMAHVTKRLPKLKEYLLVYKQPQFMIAEVQKIRSEKWNREYKMVLENFTEDAREAFRTLQEKPSPTARDVAAANALFANVRLRSLADYFSAHVIPKPAQEAWKFAHAWKIVQPVGAASIRNYALALKCIPAQDIAALLTKENVLCLFNTRFNASSRDPRIRILFADDYLYTTLGDFWADIKTSGGVGREGGVEFTNGKKPEQLLERLLRLATKKGDLVLDPFAGSGTTAAVAHKMGRQWIAIEQQDYIHTHTKIRLKNVLGGEQRGISTSVAWHGGGHFTYCELAKAQEPKRR